VIKIKLKCKNCGWTWNYKGEKTVYATCPDCKSPVHIKKQKISDNNE